MKRPSAARTEKSNSFPAGLPKCPTGIHGLDELTFGGLPRGRPTLVCGSAGCGKTLLGMEFLVRGATQFNEPGVFISFEETADELSSNVASLGFDVGELVTRKKLAIDHVAIERSQIEEAGEYDLEALFVRIAHAVDSMGAKRVVLDSVETLFAGLANESVLRAEMRRLFHWFKRKGLTAFVTAERGEGALTRHGLEEYISDCVILLEHRVTETVFTRRLRIVKYRGSTHGTNEYPFLIDHEGISVLPVTSIELKHVASQRRVSTGVPELDAMLGGKGYFQGSSVLVSGTAGSGKTSLAAHFVEAACARGERCVFFTFEESPNQVTRNMRSIGIDLGRWINKGLLRFDAVRPTTFGLEMHLVRIHKIIKEIKPGIVVLDPVTGLLQAGTGAETHGMLLRLVDMLKERQITALFTTLTSGGAVEERTGVNISSLMDTWLLVRDIESAGERNRGIYVLKARGLAHSNQIREFLMTNRGVQLREVYLGENGALTGSARLAQETRLASGAVQARQEIERKEAIISRKRKALEAQMAALRFELETEELEARQLMGQEAAKLKNWEQAQARMAKSRSVAPGATLGKLRKTERPGGRKR